MNQPFENQLQSASDIIDFFQSRIQLHPAGAAGSYRKALGRLLIFVRGRGDMLESISAAILEDWFAAMVTDGLTPLTASHYFDAVAALYSAAAGNGLQDYSDIFSEVKKEIRRFLKSQHTNIIGSDDFRRLVALTRTSESVDASLKPYSEMLVLMLQSGMTLAEATQLRRRDIDTLPQECRELARRNASSSRSYLFPLRQSLTTPGRVAAAAEERIRGLLLSRNLPVIGNVDETVRSFRAYAAMQCGADASGAMALSSISPKGIPVLSICRPALLSEAELQQLRSSVAEIFRSCRLQWFVMRMRPRVRIGMLASRMRQIKDKIPSPEIFYPCDEITRRIGKKLVTVERPVIPDIVFFRSRIGEVAPLFRNIGDLAWCYATGRGAGSTYAPVSPVAMENFQRAIGKFTPDYEVVPAGTLLPGPGERVVVIGGLFQGYEAEIEKIEPGKAGIIYRLNIVDGQGVEWRVSLDSRLTQAKSV